MWCHCRDSTAKGDSPNEKFKHEVYFHKTGINIYKWLHLCIVYSPWNVWNKTTYRSQIYDICGAYSPARYKHSDSQTSGIQQDCIWFIPVYAYILFFIFVELSFYYHDFVCYYWCHLSSGYCWILSCSSQETSWDQTHESHWIVFGLGRIFRLKRSAIFMTEFRARLELGARNFRLKPCMFTWAKLGNPFEVIILTVYSKVSSYHLTSTEFLITT